MMPPAQTFTEAEILQFLGGARETVAAVRIAWLASCSRDGGTNARAVDTFAGAAGSDEWTRRFLVRRTSRKVGEIRAAPQVTLAFQHPSGDRYVALCGRATINEDTGEMRSLWPGEMDKFFPPGFADANMVVVQVEIDRIEVHVRGLTPEPFGTGRTLLKRSAGAWRVVPMAANLPAAL